MRQQKIYTAQELQMKSLEELRTISTQLGKVPHHASKEKRIMSDILLQQDMNRPVRDPEAPSGQDQDRDPMAPAVTEKATVCSPEEVVEAIASFRPEGMKVGFKDGCFHFEHRGRVDSGNLAQPLSHIVKLARLVAKGGRKPAQVKVNGENVLAG